MMIYQQLEVQLLQQNSNQNYINRLLEKCGAEIVGFNFIIVLEFLNARDKIKE